MLRVKLKPGVIIREIDGACILKETDGQKRSYFKVSGGQLNLLSRLQNGMDVQEMINQATDGDKASALSFVTRLADLNLLDGVARDHLQKVPPLGMRIIGKLFSLLRIKIFQFDPDRLLAWMHDNLRLGFFYKPSFLVPAFAFSIIMVVLLFSEGFFSFSPSLPEKGIGYFVLFYFFLALGIFVHELAHSMTCKHWGGEIKSLGFLLYYFLPAGFSDISDSYLFNKFRRISVVLAGPLTTLFIGLWLGGIWLITEKGTLLNYMLYYFTLISILAPLFSLNPLLKFDGYFILAEIVGIENLRRNSFNYLKILMKRVFKNTVKPPALTRKERTTYLIYGLVSGVYSVIFLSFSICKLISLSR
jgi:Zn-dependent protease